MYLSDVFTVGASLAGLPAMSVPCGLQREAGCRSACSWWDGAFDEATLFRVADAYERDTGLWQLAPSGARRRGGA